MAMNQKRVQRLLGDADVSSSVLTILDEVYAFFRTNLKWPRAKDFHIAMWRKGIEIQKEIPGAVALVSGYDLNSNESKTMPSFAGLGLVIEAEHDLENALKVLHHLGDLYAENPDHNLVPATAVGDRVNVLGDELRRVVAIGMLGHSPYWTSNGPDVDKAQFQVHASHLYFANINSVDELLDYLFPSGVQLYPGSEGELFGKPEEGETIDWLIRTIPHFQWGAIDMLTHHLSAAQEHALASPSRWDDCASQLRKALEGMIVNYSDAIASRSGSSIPAKQGKPTVAERIHFLRDRAILTPNEDAVFYAVYGWLSANGAHPGIPSDVEGRSKYVVTCQLLKLFVTSALNAGLPPGPSP